MKNYDLGILNDYSKNNCTCWYCCYIKYLSK